MRTLTIPDNHNARFVFVDAADTAAGPLGEAAGILRLTTHHHQKGPTMPDWLCSLSLRPSVAAHLALACSFTIVQVLA